MTSDSDLGTDRRYHVDDELVPATDATVSVEDRGFAYGDAAFETMRAYGGELFEWDAHAERLDRTCTSLALDHGLDRADLCDRIDDTLAANDLEDAYVRLSVTRGVQPGKLTPSPDVDPTVVVIVAGLPRGGVDGASVWDGPATVETTPVRTIPDESLPADAKTHNYLNNVLARTTVSPDADEALLSDTDGRLLEGAASNLFFVRDGTLCTPNDARDLLPGITRAVVLDLAADADLSVRHDDYILEDLLAAEEAFLTNSTWEVRPIMSVDDTAIGDGPVTEDLAARFDRLVEARHYG